MLETAYLSLGSNLGDRWTNLRQAVEELSGIGIQVRQSSSVYETEPQDVVAQPWFLNIVLEIQTELSPLELLDEIQGVESKLGRMRTEVPNKGPRLIDIDILLFGGLSVSDERLTIPHPQMTGRRFVLEPLVEISPDLRNPQTGALFRDLLPGVRNQEIVIWPGPQLLPPAS